MGSFGEKRKKIFFRFCQPILDIFGFPLLNKDGGLYFLLHKNIAHIMLFSLKKNIKQIFWTEKRYN